MAYRDVREFVKHVPSSAARTFAAGSLYFGCKLEGVARSEREIAAMCGVDKARLTVVCKTYKKHLARKSYGRQMLVGVRATDLLNRAIDRLGLDTKTTARVKRTASDLDAFAAKTKAFAGKTPAGICAGVVVASLHVCCVAVPNDTVSAACNVSVGTLTRLGDTLVSTISQKNLVSLQE
jgi:transcription initiation factor TFIIIB Brf1 subunit/transcription initiation factor TFIIB